MEYARKRGYHLCMLRPVIFLTTVLLLSNASPCGLTAGHAFQSSSPPPVEAEEYAAYSAFINQEYIPLYSTPVYTLQGGLFEDGELDEKGTVVIDANIAQEFANHVGVSRYLLQLFMRGEANKEAEETYDDLIGKSGRSPRLSNKFNLKIRYELASDKESGQELYKLKWDRNKFLERFPHSKGLLSSSRVGFDAGRSKALFLVVQLDINKRERPPSQITYLVLLNKEGGRWRVNKMWPDKRPPLIVNLAQCDKASRHVPLPLGSESFSITGRDGDGCGIEHVREIEEATR